MIGILAYGSLIADPGLEIKQLTDRTIAGVETPFAIEYARKSKTRSYAPTLVPVVNEKGWRVNANIFVLNQDVPIDEAKNILYRREIHVVGNLSKIYSPPSRPGINSVVIQEIIHFCDVDLVLSTRIGANISEILDDNQTDQNKAELLADLAIKSITSATFPYSQDGVYYLLQAMQYGVVTKLTELYTQTILHLTDSSDLAEDRIAIARNNRVIS